MFMQSALDLMISVQFHMPYGEYLTTKSVNKKERKKVIYSSLTMPNVHHRCYDYLSCICTYHIWVIYIRYMAVTYPIDLGCLSWNMQGVWTTVQDMCAIISSSLCISLITYLLFIMKYKCACPFFSV